MAPPRPETCARASHSLSHPCSADSTDRSFGKWIVDIDLYVCKVNTGLNDTHCPSPLQPWLPSVYFSGAASSF